MPPIILYGVNLKLENLRTCKFCIDAIHTGVYSFNVDSRDVIKLLKDDGWYVVGQEGSHIQFKHPTKRGRVTVPHPVKDIPDGTLGSIRRQAGLKLR